MNVAWKPKLVTNSSKNDDYFHDLSMGYVPALIIPNIINNEECQRITSRILSANQTSSGLGITKKIGESLNSYLHNKDYRIICRDCLRVCVQLFLYQRCETPLYL